MRVKLLTLFILCVAPNFAFSDDDNDGLIHSASWVDDGKRADQGCVNVQVPGRADNLVMSYNSFQGMKNSGVKGIYPQGAIPCPVNYEDESKDDSYQQDI